MKMPLMNHKPPWLYTSPQRQSPALGPVVNCDSLVPAVSGTLLWNNARKAALLENILKLPPPDISSFPMLGNCRYGVVILSTYPKYSTLHFYSELPLSHYHPIINPNLSSLLSSAQIKPSLPNFLLKMSLPTSRSKPSNQTNNTKHKNTYDDHLLLR
jgi:hypothetical protein